MKSINLLVLSLLLANSAEAIAIKEVQNIDQRTITEALNEVNTHQKKHKHHHHHQSDSDSDEVVDVKKTGETKSLSLAQ